MTGIEPRITDPEKKKIRRYLGCFEETLPPELENLLDEVIPAVRELCRPRFVWKILDAVDGHLPDADFSGEDIHRHLSGCERVVLLCATIGSEIDRALTRMQVSDPARACVMEACAGAAVENLCLHFEDDLRKQLAEEGLFLTDSFSPGYGDMPLTDQQILFDLLQPQAMTGVQLGSSFLMTPRKSMTAVYGISETEKEKTGPLCGHCSAASSCSFRKHGLSCQGELE